MLLQRSSHLVRATLNSAPQARRWIHINKWWPLKAKPRGFLIIWPPRWMSPRPKWIKGRLLYDVMPYQLRIWCDYTVCRHHCVLCFSDLFFFFSKKTPLERDIKQGKLLFPFYSAWASVSHVISSSSWLEERKSQPLTGNNCVIHLLPDSWQRGQVLQWWKNW